MHKVFAVGVACPRKGRESSAVQGTTNLDWSLDRIYNNIMSIILACMCARVSVYTRAHGHDNKPSVYNLILHEP